ncbi:hypothetical protein [Paenibacillus sp. CR_12]|uniref:hypothetical protein n=1 Tax=Paenibacillus sp. CR_12 TaxID=3055793 RepID=UPI0035C23577
MLNARPVSTFCTRKNKVNPVYGMTLILSGDNRRNAVAIKTLVGRFVSGSGCVVRKFFSSACFVWYGTTIKRRLVSTGASGEV